MMSSSGAGYGRKWSGKSGSKTKFDHNDCCNIDLIRSAYFRIF